MIMAVYFATGKSPAAYSFSTRRIIPDLSIIIECIYQIGAEHSRIASIAGLLAAACYEQQDGDTEI
jgi:hypothetical protein